ncbi:hypothetical protein GGS21DRAFT_3621 [Xylaria nigripes]|nr:hypothetical protein GGS21DRAFT_3621 [Xylaria nigripes]
MKMFSVVDSLAALVKPLAVAWHAAAESGIKAGQDSLVFGTSPIRLAIILMSQGTRYW